MLDPNWITILKNLQPNWDGEGADVPSEESINSAKEIVTWASQNNLDIEDVDADVMGGVAIYLRGVYNRTVWLAIMNSGSRSIILQHDRNIVGHVLDDNSINDVKDFLIAGECSLCAEHNIIFGEN